MRNVCHRCGNYSEGFFNLTLWVCDECHENQIEADAAMGHEEELWMPY